MLGSHVKGCFGIIPDPDLPGHLLLEQYQAQLVSAVRTALDTYAGPILLETGLQLATKILTNGIISGDQVAVKRIFSLISRPLNNFEDLYYPSCAEWVSCKWKPFLDGIQSPLVSAKLQPCLEEAWPVIFQAVALDAAPLHFDMNLSSQTTESTLKDTFISGYSMVQLKPEEFRFLWGFALLVLFQGQDPALHKHLIPLGSAKAKLGGNSPVEDTDPLTLKLYEIVLPVFQFLSSERFFSMGFLTMDICRDLLQSSEYQFCWEKEMALPFVDLYPSCYTDKRSNHFDKFGVFWLKQHHLNGKFDAPLRFSFHSSSHKHTRPFQTMETCKFDAPSCFSFRSSSPGDLSMLGYTWDSLAISVLSQIVRNCPKDFLETESFASLIMELCLAYLFKVFQRNGTICSDNSNWEDMVYVSLTTAKTLIGRLGPERQLKSLLVLLLIGYKYIRGASTDVCFSKANEFVQCMNPLLNTIVDDKSKLGDEGICYLRTIIGACLDAIASLTKNCIESIHLVENTRSSSCKLLQTKLAFALEQMSSLAKLAYEIVCLGENQENDPILFTVIQHCTKCIQIVLTDTNIQVLSIGLQVLKSMVQRGTNSESNSFLLFFNGELLREIFTLIDRMLRKPISREAVAIASESLRVLVILQTLSRASECQKGLMNLLLEAVVMVFSASDDGLSQELNDLRSMVGKLVSQLAQIPSSAVNLKDVLLTMPVASRQQLQGIIRAAVTQEHKATQTKPAMPSLVIKLPAQTEETRQKGPTPTISTTPEQFDNSSEEEEEDDDWDAFQSFPASTSEVTSSSKVESATEEPALVEKSSILDFTAGNSDIPEHAGSRSRDYVKVADSDQTAVDTEQCHRHHQMDELVPSPDDQSFDVAEGFSEQCDDHLDEICHKSTDHENLDTSESVKVAEACAEPCNELHEEEFQAVLSRENDEASDLQPVDCAEEYTEPLGNKHRDRDGTVASDNDIDIAPTGLQSIEAAKRLAKLNTLDDDTEQKEPRSVLLMQEVEMN
ncbi:HEAT repeat-containing protein [Actinidia rufa]|uniref:HEAT repeat-containing protein n=1 Tax=Actinidia rufa TaxID=165716 RepID=A0A7J0H767_9ERIC|nr:HEAT repeat-containing protein [Actinidia rufa]